MKSERQPSSEADTHLQRGQRFTRGTTSHLLHSHQVLWLCFRLWLCIQALASNVIYWYCCQSTEEIKVTGRERRARTKTEIVTTDLQPHAGNAAWLHHPSHMGLCNSLDTVHSHDPTPIQETLIWATGLISVGTRKIFGKIKFVRSKVALLRLPEKSMVASDDSVSAQAAVYKLHICDFCEVGFCTSSGSQLQKQASAALLAASASQGGTIVSLQWKSQFVLTNFLCIKISFHCSLFFHFTITDQIGKNMSFLSFKSGRWKYRLVCGGKMACADVHLQLNLLLVQSCSSPA